MNWQDFINPELLVLIPVLYLLGEAIKKSAMPNKFIPLTLGLTSVFLCALWVFATNDVAEGKAVLSAIFTSITQGVLIAGASVYANQLLVQSKKEE